MKEVFVLGAKRVPFTKSFGHYLNISTQALMEASLQALVRDCHLEGRLLDDVALGAVINSALNPGLARECVLSTSLDPRTPAYSVQRACGTSLEAAGQIFAKIRAGLNETGVAGGVDTNSATPVELNETLRLALLEFKNSRSTSSRLKALLASAPMKWGLKIAGITEPRTGLSMGQHCEIMVKEWQVTQKEQDDLALQSHQNAERAYKAGFYSELVVPFCGLSKDTFVRPDTTIEKLARLKPAFDSQNGSITAGNASPLSDGSSAVLLGSQAGAKLLGLKPWAEIVDIQTSAVDFVGGEGLLMAPTMAIARLLTRNHLKLQDFDYYEIHEAFAGQVICTLRALDDEKYCREKLGAQTRLGTIDNSKMNVAGGSLALGHPFAATGGRILAGLAKLLRGSDQLGLISICTAGGMGIAAIIKGVE